jgi:hypothetical protein
MKGKKVDDHLKEELKDPHFRELQENGEFSSVFSLEKVLGSLGLTVRLRIIPLRGKIVKP